jgi:hypothetical protein
MSVVITENILEWRRKAADGTITLEEMKLAIEAIRKERAQLETPKPKTRAKAGAAARPKKQKPEDVDSDDLLKQLGIDL